MSVTIPKPKFKANTGIACRQVMIGFCFNSNWLSKWREIFEPITNHNDAKPKQLCNYFRHSIENHSITEL